jgi:AcrR family transcriptional regulator
MLPLMTRSARTGDLPDPEVTGRRAGAAPRRPGRPRRADVEDTVLDATIDLLAEKGADGTTMSAVIERSGVARATVYRRWPNRLTLITAAVRRTMGPPVMALSGNVETDLRRAAERVRDVFSSPNFRAVFPALVSGLTRPGSESDDPGARIRFDAIAPGRAGLVDGYRRHALRQGFRADVPASLAVDTVIGACMGYYLAVGRPLTVAERDLIVEVLLDGLRSRPVTRP